VSKYDCRFRLGRFDKMDPMKASTVEAYKRKSNNFDMSLKAENDDMRDDNSSHRALVDYGNDLTTVGTLTLNSNSSNSNLMSYNDLRVTMSDYSSSSASPTQANEDVVFHSPASSSTLRSDFVYDTFVKKHRRVIRSGFLLKVAGLNEKDRSFYMILFNDMFIIAKVVDENLTEITAKFDPLDKYQELAEEYRRTCTPKLKKKKKKRQQPRNTTSGSALSNIVGLITSRSPRPDQNDVVNGYLRIKQQLPVDECFGASDMLEITDDYNYYLNRYGEMCFQIRSSIESFVAVCKGQVQKRQWLSCFNEA
ncbi:hypothetical protein RFI_20122, partial [Reticulomyxa filosa]